MDWAVSIHFYSADVALPTACAYWSATATKGESQKQGRIKVSPKRTAVLEQHKTTWSWRAEEGQGSRAAREKKRERKSKLETEQTRLSFIWLIGCTLGKQKAGRGRAEGENCSKFCPQASYNGFVRDSLRLVPLHVMCSFNERNGGEWKGAKEKKKSSWDSVSSSVSVCRDLLVIILAGQITSVPHPNVSTLALNPIL